MQISTDHWTAFYSRICFFFLGCWFCVVCAFKCCTECFFFWTNPSSNWKGGNMGVCPFLSRPTAACPHIPKRTKTKKKMENCNQAAKWAAGKWVVSPPPPGHQPFSAKQFPFFFFFLQRGEILFVCSNTKRITLSGHKIPTHFDQWHFKRFSEWFEALGYLIYIYIYTGIYIYGTNKVDGTFKMVCFVCVCWEGRGRARGRRGGFFFCLAASLPQTTAPCVFFLYFYFFFLTRRNQQKKNDDEQFNPHTHTHTQNNFQLSCDEQMIMIFFFFCNGEGT